MSTALSDSWSKANQQYLVAAIAVIREQLRCYVARLQETQQRNEQEQALQQAQSVLQDALVAMPAPPALEMLCTIFGLSSFERAILLLCTGIELDADMSMLCALAQGNTTRSYPTFQLALAALPEAYWSALPPNAPLRYWRFIELGNSNVLMTTPLYLDERILHYVTGIQHLDERLASFIEPIPAHESKRALAASHQVLTTHITALWSHQEQQRTTPIISLWGSDRAAKRTIATCICDTLSFNLCSLSALAIPTQINELDTLVRLWEREAILSRNVLLLDCEEADTEDAAHSNALSYFIERANCLLILTSRERRRVLQRPMHSVEICKPTTEEQRTTWQQSLGELAHTMGRWNCLPHNSVSIQPLSRL